MDDITGFPAYSMEGDRYVRHNPPDMVQKSDGYRPRLIDTLLKECLEASVHTYLRGPRDCGKTRTAMNHVNDCINLEDICSIINHMGLTRADIALHDSPVLIDEWLATTAVHLMVRDAIDRGWDGTAIFCNSYDPGSTGPISPLDPKHAVRHILMRTMSSYESGDSDGSVALKGLFRSEFEEREPSDVTEDELARMVCRGGWPETVGKGFEDSKMVRERILRAIEEKDACSVVSSVRPYNVSQVIRALARCEGTTAPDKEIRSGTQASDGNGPIGSKPFADSLMALRWLFIVEDLPSYRPDDVLYSRILRSAERHLVDPSLAVTALGMTPDSLRQDSELFERMFGAMCVRDLRVYAEVEGGSVHHYRDSNGGRIDIVVEFPDGRWGAFCTTPAPEGVDGCISRMDRAVEHLERYGGRPPEFRCVVCGTSVGTERLPDGTYIVPVTRLRD